MNRAATNPTPRAPPAQERTPTFAGPETPALARALAAAATHSGLDVRSAEAADIPALYPALRSVLEQPAVLVITPDGQVFNSQTVHHVLLTAFRLRAPVLGFSAAYVRAGAVLGLYTTPAQAGTEAGRGVRRGVAGQAPPPAGGGARWPGCGTFPPPPSGGTRCAPWGAPRS